MWCMCLRVLGFQVGSRAAQAGGAPAPSHRLLELPMLFVLLLLLFASGWISAGQEKVLSSELAEAAGASSPAEAAETGLRWERGEAVWNCCCWCLASLLRA